MAQYLFDPQEYLTEQNWAASTDRWSNTAGLYTSTTGISRDSPFKDRTFRVLQNNGTTERYLRAFDAIDADAGRATVEVLVLFKSETSSNGNETRINVRASGNYSTATGYSFGAISQTNQLNIKKLASGTPSTLGTQAMTITEDAWYWMRISAVGSALKLRVWADGTTEPTAWSLEVTNADISAAGWVGIQHGAVAPGTISYTRFAFVSVGTGGDSPPAVLSRTAWRAWLRRDVVLRTVLAEVGAMDVATPTTYYLANRHYESSAVDTPASQRYDEAILEAPSFVAAAAEALTGRSNVTLGELAIDDSDGSRDWWLKGNVDGRDCTLLVGDADWPRYDFRPLATAVVEYVRTDGFGAIALKLRDRQRLIDGPIQETLIGGAADNAERLVPLTIGRATWFAPVGSDPATLEYRLHDGALVEVGDVYDNAVALIASATISSVNAGTDTITTSAAHGMTAKWVVTFATTAGNIVAGTLYYVVSAGLTTTEFRISATPGGATFDLNGSETGTLTAKARRVDLATGKMYLANPPSGEIRVAYAAVAATANTVSDNLYWLAHNKLSLAGYLDDASFTEHAALWPDEQGIFVADRTNALDVFDALINDTLSLYGQSRDNLLFLASLRTAEDLSGGELLTFTDDDVFGGLVLERVLMPLRTIYAQWWANNDPSTQFAASIEDPVLRTRLSASHQSVDNVVVANSADEPANHALAVSRYVHATRFSEALLPAATTYLAEYRSRKVAIWTFETHLSALELRLGDNIRIVYPRWGFEGGRNAQVIGIRDRLARERVQVRVVVPDYSQAVTEEAIQGDIGGAYIGEFVANIDGATSAVGALASTIGPFVMASPMATVSGALASTISAFTPNIDGTVSELDCSAVSYGTATLGSATLTTPVTLTADRHYGDLTVQTTVKTNGWKLFVDGVLDITHASASIIYDAAGNPADNGTYLVGELGSQGGDPPTPGATNNVGNGGTGGAGGTGAIPGVDVVDGEAGYNGVLSASATLFLGGNGGDGGIGGNSNQGSNGGGFGNSPASTASVLGSYDLYTTQPWYGGTPGGGGGGGGDPGGFASGGHGASGGCGGGGVWIAARTINRSGTTPAGCISAPGYNGNTGDVPADTGGLNGGGGAGSGGGGGGWVFLLFAALTGSTATNCIRANGGSGGNGATVVGTGATQGGGGYGGDGGKIYIRNCSSGSFSTATGSAGSAPSGSTGGAGGTCEVSL